MKQPRINDFDPHAAPTLASPMDDLPSIQQPALSRAEGDLTQRPHSNSQVVRNASTDGRPYGRTTLHRVVKRYAFEFYQDQLETIRHFSLEEKLRGEKGSMSEMVRAAIDAYIRKRQQDRS